MQAFAISFVVRAAALMPLMIIVATGLWLLTKKLGFMRLDQPFSPADTRTWPLSFAAFNAGVYGLVFAAVLAVIGDNALSAGISAGVATLISLRAVPVIAFRHFNK